MSKKKFTDGLESLFGETAEKKHEEDQLVLFEESRKSSRKTGDSERRASSGKDFTSDLQSFLAEAFEDSFEEQLGSEGGESSSREQRTRRRPRPASGGLDALIRSTIQPRMEEPATGPTRRITLIIDRQKLEKLKNIAHKKKSYLKDVIDEIVSEFIQHYEAEKGKIK